MAHGAHTILAIVLIGLPALDRGVAGAQEPVTPEAGISATSVLPVATASDVLPGAPHLQVIAQGVVTIEGPIVWRVREAPVNSAGSPESPPDSFALQRTGAAIIRNELTGRRIRLEPGEADFLPAGDPVLRTAVGTDPSLLWAIELLAVNPADTGPLLTGTQLFVSDATNDYPRGTFEVELACDVLLPGEVSVLPPTTGPALVMVTSGQIEVSLDGGPAATMQAGEGRLVSGNASLRNTTAQAAAVVVAALGEPISGTEPASPLGQAALSPTQPASTSADLPPGEIVSMQPTLVPTVVPTPVPTIESLPAPETGDTDGDGLSDLEEAVYGSDPLNRDYDGDGLLDGEEVYLYGTDPINNDTDGDGLRDGEEVSLYGTDPTLADSDGDGLGDAEELFVFGTDPLRWDTDGDGISDGEEAATYGTNPLDPASGP